MNAELSNRFQQLVDINLQNAEPIVFDAALPREPYSFIHNLAHGSFRPANVLEFAYQHKLHGLDIHVDDGGEHSLTHSTPKQLAQFKTYAQWLKRRLPRNWGGLSSLS